MSSISFCCLSACTSYRWTVNYESTNKTEAEIPDMNFDCSLFLLCCHRNSIPCFKCCVWSHSKPEYFAFCVFRSVGVLAYVMLTGISPFLGEDKQETFLNISQLSVSYSDEELQQLDPAALSFIQMLLRKHPQSVTETTQFTLMWPQNVVSFLPLCISLIFGA